MTESGSGEGREERPVPGAQVPGTTPQGTTGPGGDEPRPPRRTGWAGRVTVKTGTHGFAFVPGEVLTTDPDRADRLTQELFPARERAVEKLDLLNGRYSRLPEIPDVPRLVRHLRIAGVPAQPNHVFFAHCDDPCCGRPHPAYRGGCGGAAANPVYASPVYASPVYASPVYASPVYASPVYASPVYASPVYASPVYASPVYASPVYASDYIATGHRRSSALPVSEEDAADVAARLAHVQMPAGSGPPDVVVLDTGLARAADFLPQALTNLAPVIVPGGAPGAQDEVPDSVPAAGDQLLDPAAGHGTFIAGLVERVAPGARVELWRVIQPAGDGNELAISALIDSLPRRDGQGDKGAILNLSFGGHVMEHADMLATAIRLAQGKGYVVVASAGNDATCLETFPAAYPEVVSVGAIGPDGPAPFSNFGPWVRACAPGVDLVSTFFQGFSGAETPVPPGQPDPDNFVGWARWSGTSFSAPIVAGALAQLMLTTGVSATEAVARLIDDPSLLRLADLGTVVNVL
jgi:hypothetical protein